MMKKILCALILVYLSPSKAMDSEVNPSESLITFALGEITEDQKNMRREGYHFLLHDLSHPDEIGIVLDDKNHEGNLKISNDKNKIFVTFVQQDSSEKRVLYTKKFILKDWKPGYLLSFDVSKENESKCNIFIQPRYKPINPFILYELKMNEEKKPLTLVVGCGHKKVHGRSEKGMCHRNSFTICSDQGVDMSPDISGVFPDSMPQNAMGKFSEIFFENVNGGTKQHYEKAFHFLKPGGILVDDMHNETYNTYVLGIASIEEAKRVEETVQEKIQALFEAGFFYFKFEALSNPRNGRPSHLLNAMKEDPKYPLNPLKVRKILNIFDEHKEIISFEFTGHVGLLIDNRKDPYEFKKAIELYNEGKDHSRQINAQVFGFKI